MTLTASLSKKFEIGIFVSALVVLGIVWAVNGYEDTWLYATAAVIAIPISWYSFSKSDKS